MRPHGGKRKCVGRKCCSYVEHKGSFFVCKQSTSQYSINNFVNIAKWSLWYMDSVVKWL